MFAENINQMKIKLIILFITLVAVSSQAQNTKQTKNEKAKLTTLITNIEEKVNKLYAKRNDAVLKLKEQQLIAKKECQAKMFTLLDKIEYKSTDKFKETYKYELEKYKYFVANQQMEISLLENFYLNKIAIINNKKNIDIARLN